ncbi:MAG: UDP-N-acetylmuramoyl-tripeptide--D-alanyl-D-alanine ligase [Defluviitaleaceae bacterium]|nr:UDP-N-acetylmuramoyl-tripeptide--D-alanyl-D-alanine ligase [Defluviitaleaceae bacterium]
MQLTIREITTAVNGRLAGNPSEAAVTSICTDTRKIHAGALFVPLKGERVDGHSYLQSALENGAACALTEQENNLSHTGPLIYVKSTRRALMDLAAYYRRKHNIKVVAITGSAGKTTTKEMIAHVLQRKYKTKKTMGNFNNDIGLPLSIFQLTPEDEVLVLEMGMNHGGEIHELSLTGAPNIAVITNIGDAHIENFEKDGREGILHAKLEILDGLSLNGTAVFNGDDPLLMGKIAMAKAAHFKLLTPNASNIKSMDEVNIAGGKAHFVIGGQDIHINVPLPGAHMVKNALIAATVGIEMGLSPEEITQGFDDFIPPGGRLGIMEIAGMTVINDVYNANPASMQEGIKVTVGQDGRRVCILGGMNELGQVSEPRHKEVGAFAADMGINLLVTIGSMAWWINEGFYGAILKRQREKGRTGNQPLLDENAERLFDIPKRTIGLKTTAEPGLEELGKILRQTDKLEDTPPQMALHFDTIPDFLKEWPDILRPGDVILVKASRGMAFEDVINGLK